jgi:alanine racemase
MLDLTTVDIDLTAIADNLAALRSAIPAGTKVYGVVKGDAYGIGHVEAAAALVAAGIDGLAAGHPDEALTLAGLHPCLPILAYGTYTADEALELARQRVRPTVFSLEMAARFAAGCSTPADIHVEVDCGFGRIGILPEEAGEAFGLLAGNRHIGVPGLYTHLGSIEDAAAVRIQAERYRQTLAAAEAAGFRGLERMVNSSRTALDFPELCADAINPGRMLYGLLEAPWSNRVATRPAIAALRSRIIQVKPVIAGRFLGYGQVDITGISRCAIAPLGFAGGLPRGFDGAPALLRGQRTRVIGTASMEHLIVDTTHIPDAAAGDELVLLGRQGEEAISGPEMARATGLSELEILPRLARGYPRRYLR